MSELSPRQVRALILLLIIAPLIPTVLMLQLMMGAVQGERAAAQEEAGEVYDQALHTAVSLLTAHLKAEGAEGESFAALTARAKQTLDRCFSQGAKVRLIPPSATPHNTPAGGMAPMLAEATLEAPLSGWRVELFQDGPDAFAEASRYQVTVFTAVGGGAIVLNLMLAGLAGYALNRQMRVQELKSSSLETVAHELRTPLASMRVLLDTLLAKTGELAKPTAEYVELISNENARLIHLTESFLTLARLERGGCRNERRAIAPAELFGAALETVWARVGESHQEVRVEVPRVMVDKDAVTVALSNLIDNAMKYSNGEKEITLRAVRENGGVEFQVIDRGIGIARAEQKRIFERFYQVNQTLARTHEGCGLGLSIVKSIVNAHGGKIKVASREGEGTAVGVFLPCT